MSRAIEQTQSSVRIEEKAALANDRSIMPVWDGKHYKNYKDEPLIWQFLKTLYLLFPGMFAKPIYLADRSMLCIDKPTILSDTRPTLMWLGHSTIYLRHLNGINILIDPSSSDIKPWPNAVITLYKRYYSLPIALNKLPVDVIFLSHNHEDHAGTEDLQNLAKRIPQPKVIVGKRSSPWLQSLGFQAENIKEMSWWDHCVLIHSQAQKAVNVIAVPACHAAQPKQWKNQQGVTESCSMNGMLWLGLILQFSGATIYFSGDTSLGVHMEDRYGNQRALFHQIHEKFPKIDVACIEASPDGEPEVHLGAENALMVLNILKVRFAVPVHHSCFRSDSRSVEAPIQAFMQKADEQKLEETCLLPLKVGGQLLISDKGLSAVAHDQLINSALWRDKTSGTSRASNKSSWSTLSYSMAAILVFFIAGAIYYIFKDKAEINVVHTHTPFSP